LNPKEEGVMKTRTILGLGTGILLTFNVLSPMALGQEAAKATSPIPIPAADLKWTDLDPVGTPGVKVADLWGDHTKGPFGAFFKLPAGFAAPLHTHTNDMKLITVSGTYVQAPKGKPAFRLGPGSFLMQPGGNYQHTTSCDAGSDCLFFVESTGAFDLKMVAPAPPKSQ
jgi:anti-sigma factor ChrR (cupin superfamily)